MSSSRGRAANLVLSCLIAAVFLVMLLLSQGCLSRRQLLAHLWLNNGMDPEICAHDPAAKQYGFYRRLNSGQFEFISFCDPSAKDWVSVNKADLEKLLNGTLPPEPQH